MVKSTRIDQFFKRKLKEGECSNINSTEPTANKENPVLVEDIPSDEHQPSKKQRPEPRDVDMASFVRDPGLRPPITDYHVNQRDDIQRRYITAGPYQHILSQYPLSKNVKNPRRFQASWFQLFPEWLEYSPSKDAAYCLACYLFKPVGRHRTNAFTTEGFCNWKKVNDGVHCAFLNHLGKGPNSPHNIAVQCCKDLMKQDRHIDTVFDRQSSIEIANNRLRLQASVDVVRWLAFQACAFRGHDERPQSKNRGNFIEMIKILASYNKTLGKVVLENAPANAKYVAPKIQKQILRCFALRVQNYIRQEIGEAKYCLMVDEARDESKKEQMAIVLRFVDTSGYIRERFFDVVHVKDTSSQTLKNQICEVLSNHNLSIHNLRGQGYDGASNMRGEWGGLQALLSNECPYAYYVHCFAHRLQLALVAASKEVISVHQFFSKMTLIINIVSASTKRHDELQAAHASDIQRRIANGELETGRGLNQVGTIQRAGDTRWGSHFYSICSLMNMFTATCATLKKVIADGNGAQRAEADSVYDSLTSFEFVFVLHLMKQVLGVSDNLSQALQRESQDIVNAMKLVASTKLLIQQMREAGWDGFLISVIDFCKRHKIDVPNMEAPHTAGRGRRQKHVTVGHYYHIDIFIEVMDSQLQELNSRFSEKAMELLTLSQALDPSECYKSFNIDHICKLVNLYYSEDFSNQERIHLNFQLQHYKVGVVDDAEFHNISTMGQLCRKLVETKKTSIYPLVYRLICLILTLPVSTATTERAFSAMKIVKTRLRSKMGSGYLASCMIIYIEKEIAEKFSTDLIINDFKDMNAQPRRVQLS